MKYKDLYHGDGNSTIKSSIPGKIKNKVGRTDPSVKEKRNYTVTKKTIKKGWSK